MSREERLRARADVVAAMSGTIAAMCEHDDTVSTDYLRERFNELLEQHDVDNDALRVNEDV